MNVILSMDVILVLQVDNIRLLDGMVEGRVPSFGGAVLWLEVECRVNVDFLVIKKGQQSQHTF